MIAKQTISHAIRDEVSKHAHSVLRFEESTRKIARDHHCQNDVLIRQAILQRLKTQKQVAQL